MRRIEKENKLLYECINEMRKQYLPSFMNYEQLLRYFYSNIDYYLGEIKKIQNEKN